MMMTRKAILRGRGFFRRKSKKRKREAARFLLSDSKKNFNFLVQSKMQ